MKIIKIGIILSAALWSTTAFAAELKMAHFMPPPSHAMDVHIMSPMADAYNEAVAGTSNIKIYPAGELGPGPKAQYKRVATGVSEISFILPGFTANLFPALTAYELPGLYEDGISATQAMWENKEEIQAEVDRAVTLAFWANNPTILVTRDKAIRSPADLAGLKIRIANDNMAKTITAWGGVPVSMPPTEAYQALSTGVVDGIYIGASAISSYKLYEIAKYTTVNVPGLVSSFLIAMNSDAYTALSDAEKSAIHAASGEALSTKAAAVFAEEGEKALVLAKENGVEMISLTDAEVSEFTALLPALKAN